MLRRGSQCQCGSPLSDADKIRQDRQSEDELKIGRLKKKQKKKTRIGERVRLMDWEKRMKDRGSFAVKGKTDWWVGTGGVGRGWGRDKRQR